MPQPAPEEPASATRFEHLPALVFETIFHHLQGRDLLALHEAYRRRSEPARAQQPSKDGATRPEPRAPTLDLASALRPVAPRHDDAMNLQDALRSQAAVRINKGRGPFTEEDVALLSLADPGQVRRLALRWAPPETMRAAVERLRSSPLEVVAVAGSKPHAAGLVEELLKLDAAAVRGLSLSNHLDLNRTTADRLSTRLTKWAPALMTLDLRGTRVGPVAWTQLMGAIARMERLEHLDLSEGGMEAEQAASLGPALSELRHLRNLNLAGNRIGSDGARALAEGLRDHPTLERLDLRGNFIGDSGLRALIPLLPRLRTVGLAATNLSEGALETLVDAGALGWATSLYLEDNPLRAGSERERALLKKDGTSSLLNRSAVEEVDWGVPPRPSSRGSGLG